MMPANEMEDIVQALDLRLRDYDGLIAALRNSIDLVTEYRTRLVADVVTGKLDVREAAALLPDEAAPDTVTDDTDLSDETEPSDEEAAV
jgi:type I restriction enzyme S subunit